MDHARAAIFNLFGGEPTSYTRFSIARQMDGDNSHVEMKLAADEEEGGEIGRPDHLHASMPPPRRNGKNLCFIIMAAVLLLLIGFLIGYLSYRGRMQRVNRCLDGSGNCEMTPTASYFSDDGTEEEEVPGPRILYWPDLRNMLTAKLSASRLENNLRQREGKNSFEAGKTEDENTARRIHEQFTSFRLDDVWNDEHYVRLQDKGSSNNQVSIIENGREELLESPDAYVAYSKSGTVTGKPIYVNYGEKEDFQKLRNVGIPMKGTIIIFKAGKITLAEKVANARKEGAVGALMYLDPSNGKKADSYVPFGHAHLGTGDPFTPGFPSFNHTQFPPVESSGLPHIPVQTISRETAAKLFGKMDGEKCPQEWTSGIVGCKVTVSSSSNMTVKLTVNNIMVDRKILNIFGVIKGFEEPDRYVVIGAQRDSWGPGAAKAGVGTAILLELAQVISDMVKNDDYKPRRSIIFASWSAGEYGAVGATEWLEGYSTTLHAKAFTYINLDTAVLGSRHVKISASPLLYSLLEATMKRVKDPANDPRYLYSRVGSDWIKRVVPLDLDNAAFPFLAYSGIPVVSFGFYDEDDEYFLLGTTMDTLTNLKEKTDKLYPLMLTAAEVAGQIALRLTHDHELFLDFDRYSEELLSFQEKLWHFDSHVKALGLTLNWLYFARGDFQRAADALRRDIANSDRENRIVRRALNDRMMKVEYDFLSPYLSPKDTPFRHIFFGKGSHTLQSLLENLEQLAVNKTSVDVNKLKEQLALATWTIKGAANALVGDIWNTDNEI
ncbi:PREDICTED: transferrin receptor protein 1 [Pseudopodoces humilis]|uniref:transferrin receptor protein 1 n=1 Tax=Pseudopodoces humilis TaxID=181119 RepID=UPI000395D800|nr:PREDICTED: transferrin receptor protein 1 [Pseudopodoces humilis]XP_014109918.1 PREDICTED: transferrin receptor protein 1 [Pseudopodoces humilis]XP_014109919.1 PREDICTED: transferrin receptor protein 1 [Pseudopodoces humilis]